MGGLISRASNALRRTVAPLCAASIALGLAATTVSAGGRTVSRVLVTGGEIVNVQFATETAETWDSTTGVFSPAPSMTQPRAFHTTSMLAAGPNSGELLIAGGVDLSNTPVNTAEFYAPASGPSGSIAMNATRAYHTATVLNDGRVLIAGGVSGSGTVLDSAEVYDPTSNSFVVLTCATTPDCMTMPRSGHTATLLGNGKVLIAGGLTSATTTTDSAELFDPTSNTFTAVPNLMSDEREFGAAALLNDGTVLIAGGFSDFWNLSTVSADIFDPVAGSFSPVNDSLSVGRAGLTATVLGNGNVMMAGGTSAPTVDIYTRRSGAISPSRGSLKDVRRYGTATVLNNGTVLLAGGGTNSAEIANARASSFTLTGSMSVSREGHTATLLP